MDETKRKTRRSKTNLKSKYLEFVTHVDLKMETVQNRKSYLMFGGT